MTLSPAARRLRRVRRTMTVLFAATTAACLLVLALIAAHIDADSRRTETNADVRARATALARAVYYDDGGLHLEPLGEDELARGNVALAVVADDRVRYVRPSPRELPEPYELRRMLAEVRLDQAPARAESPTRGGRALVWAYAPVWDGDRVGAMVLVGADPSAAGAGHDRLVRALFLGCLALVLLAAAVGHWLSGRATRPALRALERQEQFLAEAAHELRTPLSVLRLALESGARSPERAPATVEQALGHVDRLGRLVTGLLARARLEAGTHRPELELLRLDQLVERTVEELPAAQGVAVQTTPSVVHGDAELLAQAVRNLVENALRYGGDDAWRAGGRGMRVGADGEAQGVAGEHDGPARERDSGDGIVVTVDWGVVAVTDHGPGVPEDRREAVFARGVGSGEGTGSGLAIVRWIAELHGGSARLLEAPGGGTRAELRLPEATPPA
jgi:two-component system OmpR family sensor kinase